MCPVHLAGINWSNMLRTRFFFLVSEHRKPGPVVLLIPIYGKL